MIQAIHGAAKFCVLLCLPVSLFAPTNSLWAQAYQVDPGFALHLPEGLQLGAVSGVAIDSQGNLVVAHRGPRPILIFNPAGMLVQSFGDAEITAVHGTRTDAADNVWITDYKNHTVVKYSPAGQVLLKLGKRDMPGNDESTFNRATDVAFAKSGEFFVSDGYGNNRVVKFDPSGNAIKIWGSKGKAEGQLHLPHAIQVASDGRLFVADRENDRIQIYTQAGELVGSLRGFAPFGMVIAEDQTLYVADGRANKCLHMTLAGERLAEWGSSGTGPGQFNLPHCIAVDRQGRVYVGEVGGQRLQRFVKR